MEYELSVRDPSGHLILDHLVCLGESTLDMVFDFACNASLDWEVSINDSPFTHWTKITKRALNPRNKYMREYMRKRRAAKV